MAKNKILIVSFTIPYPVNDGGKIYLFGSINSIKDKIDVTLLVSAYFEEDKHYIEMLRQMWPDVTIEVANCIRPANPKPALIDRIIMQLRRLKHLIFPVQNKIPVQTQQDAANRTLIDKFSVVEKSLAIKLNEILTHNKFNLIQIEYTGNISLVNLLPPDVPKIFVEIESRTEILKDYKSIFSDNKWDTAYLEYLIINCSFLEQSYMSKYDVIIALNENDAYELKQRLPGKSVIQNPFGVLESHLRNAENIAAFSPDKLIFMGSQNHAPNVDAVIWFIEEILPIIKQTKSIDLVITGQWSDGFKSKYSQIANVIFTGYVDDLSFILPNSISIVPIRLGGGGLRAKVIEAMAFGLPIVSTTLACVGIGVTNEEDILIADDKHKFANSIIRLITDRKLCLKLIGNARSLVDLKYSPAVAGARRVQIYSDILSNAL